ncbi:hypothetical protein Tco_0311532 [Tanacetum coccineum]
MAMVRKGKHRGHIPGVGRVLAGQSKDAIFVNEPRGAYMMRFLALGWHLKEIHVTWAHLEKKRIRLRLYTKNHEELCTQRLETASHP